MNLILGNHNTTLKLKITRMLHRLSSFLKTRPLLKTLDEKYEEATFAVLSYLLSQVCHPSLDHNKFRFSTGPGNRCWSELKSLKWLLGGLYRMFFDIMLFDGAVTQPSYKVRNYFFLYLFLSVHNHGFVKNCYKKVLEIEKTYCTF